MQFSITRLEEYTDRTFIRIDTDKPVWAEKFVPKGEDIKAAVADMIAELEERYAEYVEPERPVIREETARKELKKSITKKELENARKRRDERRQNERDEEPIDGERL